MPLVKSSHQSNPALLIASMLVGAVVIILCNCFSNYKPVQDLHFFNLLGLEHRRWSVGRRELVHLVGFIGCALFGWSFMRSMTHRSLRRIQTGVAIFAAVCFLLTKYPFEFIGFDLWGVLFTLKDELLIYSLVVALGLVAYRFAPRILNPIEALRTVGGAMLVISLGWELICQPVFGTYRAPDRTGLDAAQIIFDVLGITLGVLVMQGLCSLDKARLSVTGATK